MMTRKLELACYVLFLAVLLVWGCGALWWEATSPLANYGKQPDVPQPPGEWMPERAPIYSRDDILYHALRARGMPDQLAPYIRRLWNIESGGRHYNANGTVRTSEIRRGRVMVCIGQINMAPGKRRWRHWDVWTLDGNIEASVDKLHEALIVADGDLLEAIARYQGYSKPRSKAAVKASRKVVGR
jgi:hypothetical protein